LSRESTWPIAANSYNRYCLPGSSPSWRRVTFVSTSCIVGIWISGTSISRIVEPFDVGMKPSKMRFISGVRSTMCAGR
jgi:hypothetical protein